MSQLVAGIGLCLSDMPRRRDAQRDETYRYVAHFLQGAIVQKGDRQMKARTALLLATMVLLSGASAASAGSMSQPSSSTMSQHVRDTLSLNKHAAENSVERPQQRRREAEPPGGFHCGSGLSGPEYA